MSRQYWSEQIGWATASGSAIASSTTETILFPTFTIPASYFADGRTLRIRLYGGYGTTGTPTLTFTARLGGVGGTIIAKSGAITTASGVGGGASMTALWQVEFDIQTRTNGSSGTLMSNGLITLFTTGTAAGSAYPFTSGSTAGGTTPTTATVDLTTDQALAVTATWGTNNAANSIQGHNFTLDSLN